MSSACREYRTNTSFILVALLTSFMEVTIRKDSGEEKTYFNVESVWTEESTVWVGKRSDDKEKNFDGAEIIACYTER